MLGPDHTSTLDTTENLAALYKEMGRQSEGEQMYSRALLGAEAVFERSSERYQGIISALGALRDDG